MVKRHGPMTSSYTMQPAGSLMCCSVVSCSEVPSNAGNNGGQEPDGPRDGALGALLAHRSCNLTMPCKVTKSKEPLHSAQECTFGFEACHNMSGFITTGGAGF